MEKSKVLYFTLSIAMLMTSCGKDINDTDRYGAKVEYEAVKSEFNVSVSSFSIDGSEQTLRVQISSNSFWTAETKSTWLNLNNNHGKGKGTLTIEVDSNPSTTQNRKTEINVTDGIKTISIVVTQAHSTAKSNSPNEDDNPTPNY